MEVLHTLCLLPHPNLWKAVKDLFLANNSISPSSQIHASGASIAVSFCHATELREPHFQVSAMPRCQCPSGVLREAALLLTDYFYPLRSQLGCAPVVSYLEQSRNAHTHTPRMQKYRPDIKYGSYPPDCQAEKRLRQAHCPTISNVLK